METLTLTATPASFRPGSIPKLRQVSQIFFTNSSSGPSFCSSLSFSGALSRSNLSRKFGAGKILRRKPSPLVVKSGLIGENPEWSESNYVAVGLAHCFTTTDEKLRDFFVIEPIPASGLECMYNGGATSYKCVVGTTLGVALREDVSLLPEEFRVGVFAEKFEKRAKAASRTWKRDYARETLMDLAPVGVVKKDFNFCLQEKRVLGVVHEVKDEDNIKQDLSIDVYGRKKEGEEKKEDEESLISALYNV